MNTHLILSRQTTISILDDLYNVELKWLNKFHGETHVAEVDLNCIQECKRENQD